MQKQILSSLRYKDDYLPINRGWWKPNISWHAYYMQGSDSSIGEVTRMFPKYLESAEDITPSIIFVDKRALAFRMMSVLRDFLPPELGDQVEIYHALQSQIAKDRTARRFEKGTIKILICTEALTMGCDFRKVVQIILFKVPESLPTVLQRGGRAGRDETIKARVILMVEGSKRALAIAKSSPGSTFAEPMKIEDEDGDLPIEIVDLEGTDVGGEGGAGEEDEAAQEAIRVAATEHGKEDRELLQRFYAPTDQCRTLVLDEAFDSPPHARCISVNGCDNCIRRHIKELEAAKAGTHLGDGLVKQEPVDDLNALDKTIEDLRALLIEPNEEAKQKKPSTRGKYRRMDERNQLEASLKRWRGEIFKSELKQLGIRTDYIVTDRAIKAIAKVLPPVTLDSLALISPAWPEKARMRWGPSLLAKIDEYDLPDRMVERQIERAQVKVEKTRVKEEEEGGSMLGTRNKKRPASGDAPKSMPR
ncbi:hypothetical protein FRC08_005542 [Ceratobasidium sp. 394]|nr:hypothetical protein FRC08_005542 [Ceratobasidium sp. 394]